VALLANELGTRPPEIVGVETRSTQGTFLSKLCEKRIRDMSKEVADGFVEALRKLEENEDVEDLVEIHTGDCEVGNVSAGVDDAGYFERGLCRLRRCEHPGE
jgi:hypothetical protein